MIDRTRFAAQGAAGGLPGVLGELLADGEQSLQPKTVLWLAPETRVQLNLPGGGGYGNPYERPAEQVLDDVVCSYVSISAAERDYGVVVRYLGAADWLVRLPQHYAIDWDATKRLRGRVHGREALAS
jgi:N-methylhydantoinase B